MVKAMYSGVSGLRAHQSKMDVIGNNIANVNTWGYKSMTTSFKESVYQTMISSSAGGTNDGSYGGVNPSMVGYGSMVSAISANFTAGNQVYTGQASDCYIDGTAFFAVGPKYGADDAKKPEDITLSRVGNFGIINGYLVDGNGRYVYGFNAGTGGAVEEKGSALENFGVDGDGNYTFKPGDAATNGMRPIKIPTHYDPDGSNTAANNKPLNITNFTIEQDGKLYGYDDNSGKTLLLGCIGLVTVQNQNGLTKEDGPYYKLGASSGGGTIIAPGGKSGKLVSNNLESANVDIAQEFSDMITTQRGFQANSKIITVTDEMLQELVNMKR